MLATFRRSPRLRRGTGLRACLVHPSATYHGYNHDTPDSGRTPAKFLCMVSPAIVANREWLRKNSDFFKETRANNSDKSEAWLQLDRFSRRYSTILPYDGLWGVTSEVQLGSHVGAAQRSPGGSGAIEVGNLRSLLVTSLNRHSNSFKPEQCTRPFTLPSSIIMDTHSEIVKTFNCLLCGLQRPSAVYEIQLPVNRQWSDRVNEVLREQEFLADIKIYKVSGVLLHS